MSKGYRTGEMKENDSGGDVEGFGSAARRGDRGLCLSPDLGTSPGQGSKPSAAGVWR